MRRYVVVGFAVMAVGVLVAMVGVLRLVGLFTGSGVGELVGGAVLFGAGLGLSLVVRDRTGRWP